MFRRDRKEHLNDPYPGLFGNPHLLDPDFDTDHSLPLIRYRILVNGKEDARGEYHCKHASALTKTTMMLSRGRYGKLGKYLAEVEVYDAEGNLLGSDRQVRSKVAGQKTIQWQRMVGRAARAEQTEARVRAMEQAQTAR